MTTAADPLAREADRALLALSLYFVATATTHRVEGHVLDARQRGASDEQVEHALALHRRHSAAVPSNHNPGGIPVP